LVKKFKKTCKYSKELLKNELSKFPTKRGDLTAN